MLKGPLKVCSQVQTKMLTVSSWLAVVATVRQAVSLVHFSILKDLETLLQWMTAQVFDCLACMFTSLFNFCIPSGFQSQRRLRTQNQSFVTTSVWKGTQNQIWLIIWWKQTTEKYLLSCQHEQHVLRNLFHKVSHICTDGSDPVC